MGTLRTLVRKAYDICLKNEDLVFCEIKRSNHQQLHEQHQQRLRTNSSHEEAPNRKKHFLLLLYKEKRADNIIKSMKKTVHKLLPETVNTQIP